MLSAIGLLLFSGTLYVFIRWMETRERSVKTNLLDLWKEITDCFMQIFIIYVFWGYSLRKKINVNYNIITFLKNMQQMSNMQQCLIQ